MNDLKEFIACTYFIVTLPLRVLAYCLLSFFAPRFLSALTSDFERLVSLLKIESNA